jgi:cytochrome oxidase assembly protein ShyY1
MTAALPWSPVAYRECVFRSAVWALRQPRYAATAALMFVVAALCIAAGTWQVSRYEQKVRENNDLRANAHAPTVALTTGLVPLAGHGPAPGRDAIRYRTVSVSGTFLDGHQQYARNESIGETRGYYVLDPLRTDGGVLLVVRGFVADSGGNATPQADTTLPAGRVTVTGRLQTPDTRPDDASRLPGHELQTINPAEQASALGSPVYNAFLILKAHQPGTTGLRAVPEPDLSNPAGGAAEWQHLAYVIQWFIFALLALAAPFALARHEVREARQRFLGIDPGEEQFDQLDEPGDRPQLPAGGGADGVVAVRANGELARPGPSVEQWQRAAQLADRYGRSLGRDTAPPPAAPARRRRRPRRAPVEPVRPAASSATAPHRSADEFHGAYNDYLWELAMADGNIPQVDVSGGEPKDDPRPITGTTQPRVIEHDPDD